MSVKDLDGDFSALRGRMEVRCFLMIRTSFVSSFVGGYILVGGTEGEGVTCLTKVCRHLVP